MKAFASLRKYAAAAFYAVFVCNAGLAGAATLDDLFAELAAPEAPDWERAEADIQREWSKSGSPAMDLLLKRGTEAMQMGDFPAAIEHLTALTDHAPDFAEGWNARATAYFMAGYFGPSMADIRRVLALEPRHYGALAGLGMMLEEMGDKPAALAAFRAARGIHPHRPDLDEAVTRLELALQGTDL